MSDFGKLIELSENVSLQPDISNMLESVNDNLDVLSAASQRNTLCVSKRTNETNCNHKAFNSDDDDDLGDERDYGFSNLISTLTELTIDNCSHTSVKSEDMDRNSQLPSLQSQNQALSIFHELSRCAESYSSEDSFRNRTEDASKSSIASSDSILENIECIEDDGDQVEMNNGIKSNFSQHPADCMKRSTMNTTEQEADRSRQRSVERPPMNIVRRQSDISSNSMNEQMENNSLSQHYLTNLSLRSLNIVTPPLSSNIGLAITDLGKVPPPWQPDAEAQICLQCKSSFSFTKRRHHCRACGMVFCSLCSSIKTRLPYMANKESRVCSKCYQDLIRGAQYNKRLHQMANTRTNASNPLEIRSPRLVHERVLATSVGQLSQSVPSGVLRKHGSMRGNAETRKVMFSDGIRPGGDLTELEAPQSSNETSTKKKLKKKSSKTDGGDQNKKVESRGRACLLPPIVISSGSTKEISLKNNLPFELIFNHIRRDSSNPVTFVVNENLAVMVKIVNLDCCMQSTCWCFTTDGLRTVGQDEVVTLIECLQEDNIIPIDVFNHMNTLYEAAKSGNRVGHLDHTVLPARSFDILDHSGFLYIRSTFQCTQKLALPDPPYLFAVLLLKWEMSWASTFPLRLMLRLGAEFRYYPCPLVSVRHRKPVFGEIGHTIMKLLADFQTFKYSITHINGLMIDLMDKQTRIRLPQNRYNSVMKMLSNDSDHVLALGASFNTRADAHLVCIQNDEGSYHTQAISVVDRQCKVTGASFIIFNGALKSDAGCQAKLSIVEDGVMVQVTSELLSKLKLSLKQMTNYRIRCGSHNDPSQDDEIVLVEWTEDDKNVNIGVVSPIDHMSMEGIESIRTQVFTNTASKDSFLSWTEVFFIRNDIDDMDSELFDISKITQTVADLSARLLGPYTNQLVARSMVMIGLRVTIKSGKASYVIGSRQESLPDCCTSDLDSKLIPVINKIAAQARSSSVVFELIFHVFHPRTLMTVCPALDLIESPA